MTFCTLVGLFTTELQETYGSLSYKWWFIFYWLVSCISVVERPTDVRKIIGSTYVGGTKKFFRVACVTD